MKTPREILLEQHSGVQAKLDRVRREAIAQTVDAPILGGAIEKGVGPSAVQSGWRSWFWPCPQAWAGMAAAWAVIFFFIFSTPSPSRSGTVILANAVPRSLQEQKRDLAEVWQALAPPVPRVRALPPGKRSGRRAEIIAA